MGTGQVKLSSVLMRQQMHAAMAFELTCDANVDFARGMLGHHNGALDSCAVFERVAGAAADPAMLHFCRSHVGHI